MSDFLATLQLLRMCSKKEGSGGKERVREDYDVFVVFHFLFLILLDSGKIPNRI